VKTLARLFFSVQKRLLSGYVEIAIEAMAIEIVDLPIENGDFP